MRIQIITKGSTKHGLGHLFRSRTFAKVALRRYEVEVIAVIEKELEVVFQDIEKNVKYCREESSVLKHVRKFKPDIVIYDLLDIDNQNFKEIKKIPLFVASISPVFNQMNKIDVLFTRDKNFKPISDVKIYGGFEYSIFNEYCEKISDAVYKKNLKRSSLPIAISMGGTDSPNKTLKVVKSLVAFPHEITLWVALGEGYAHSYTDLVKAINYNFRHEIILAKANKSTWDILSNSVLALLTGGLTTVEAIFAGLPSINIFKNQEKLDSTAREQFNLNVSLNKHFFTDESLDLLKEKLQYLYFNRDELWQMRENTKGLIDKKGAERILTILKKMYSSSRINSI